MRRHVKRSDDTRAMLSNAVMSYLGEYRKSGGKLPKDTPEDDKTQREDRELFTWKRKGSESDAPVVSKVSTTPEPKLRVSNLLSKAAAEDKDIKEGEEYITTADGYRNPPAKPLRETVRGWQDFWKTPIASSAALGLLPALAYYGFSKFTSPDDPEDVNIKTIANELVKEDMSNGIQLKDAQYYMDKALAKHKRTRLMRALGIWGGSAALLHAQHINPSDWSQLYKYPRIQRKGVNHEASMLGVEPYKTADELRESILFDPRMSPEMKYNALGVIDYAPGPFMTSTDIVNNAVASGISGRTGLPMGRIISSAAVDAGVGYGLGKLMGASKPGRVAGLFGVGSALINAIQYASKH